MNFPNIWRVFVPFQNDGVDRLLTATGFVRLSTKESRGHTLQGVKVENSAPGQTAAGRFGLVAAPWHLLVLLAGEALLVYRGWLHTSQLRGAAQVDRIGLYERTMFFHWLTFGFVILGVRLHQSPLASVWGDRWKSGWQVLRDAGIGLAFWVVSTLIVSIVGGHGHGHEGGTDRAVLFLLPQGALESVLWVGLSITAGICEEAIYRGYLQRQFSALTKSMPLGIVISAVAFGASHAYQGLRGAMMISVQGVLLGILAQWRGSVRPGMISHAWQDTFAGVLARALKIRVG